MTVQSPPPGVDPSPLPEQLSPSPGGDNKDGVWEAPSLMDKGGPHGSVTLNLCCPLLPPLKYVSKPITSIQSRKRIVKPLLDMPSLFPFPLGSSLALSLCYQTRWERVYTPASLLAPYMASLTQLPSLRVDALLGRQGLPVAKSMGAMVVVEQGWFFQALPSLSTSAPPCRAPAWASGCPLSWLASLIASSISAFLPSQVSWPTARCGPRWISTSASFISPAPLRRSSLFVLPLPAGPAEWQASSLALSWAQRGWRSEISSFGPGPKPWNCCF